MHVGCCKVLCNGDLTYIQDSLDVYRGMAPPRGMAAVQPLTATQHEAGIGHGRICGLGSVGSSTRWRRCGAGLTGAHDQPQAEPVQVWQERGGRSPGEGHWVALAPGRYRHPALAAGGSQEGPDLPWRAAHAGHWPGSSEHGSTALPALGEKEDMRLSHPMEILHPWDLTSIPGAEGIPLSSAHVLSQCRGLGACQLSPSRSYVRRFRLLEADDRGLEEVVPHGVSGSAPVGLPSCRKQPCLSTGASKQSFPCPCLLPGATVGHTFPTGTPAVGSQTHPTLERGGGGCSLSTLCHSHVCNTEKSNALCSPREQELQPAESSRRGWGHFWGQ